MEHIEIETLMDFISKSPKFRPFMKWLALMGGVAAVAGVLLKLSGNVQLGTPFLVTGMSTLAVVALPLKYLFPYPAKDDEAVDGGLRTMWNFAMTLTGYALAVAIVGLLFWLQYWVVARKMLLIAAGSLVCCALVWLYFLHLKKKTNNNH